MQIPFSKYVGCGNDFILVDNRLDIFPTNNKDLITRLCARHHGIGADGIILVEKASTDADAKMRIFNADGSEAEMCGNGIRCLGRFLKEIGLPGPVYKIQTAERLLLVHLQDDSVSVEMGPPTDIRWSIPINIEDNPLVVHYLNTGVPHAILFVENLEHSPLENLGPSIRHHSEFSPKGTNVNIATIKSAENGQSNEVSIRTYERGVEAETLACGTGATATALAAAELYQLKSPIRIFTKSGESVDISFHLDTTLESNKFTNVTQSGPAKHIFSGSLSLLG